MDAEGGVGKFKRNWKWCACAGGVAGNVHIPVSMVVVVGEAIMKKNIYEEKRNYIARLSLLLSADYRSDVESVRYVQEGEDEYAEITFFGGHVVAANITGNSCGAIYKEVGKVVYG